LFPIVQDAIGWGTTFVVFGSIIAAGLLFILLKVPETKGMSLEEIQMQLKGALERKTSGQNSEFHYRNMDNCDDDPDKKKPLASILLKQSRMESNDLTPIV
jgi:hypothetical protein